MALWAITTAGGSRVLQTPEASEGISRKVSPATEENLNQLAAIASANTSAVSKILGGQWIGNNINVEV